MSHRLLSASGVSVVLPARNAAAYVREAVESIVAQTHRPIEIVVVDDGSTDETLAEIEKVDRRGVLLRVVDGPRQGISAAHNAGVRAARYAWIAIMHADDVAAPERLARQMAAAQAHPEVVAWGTFARHINRRGRVLGYSASGCTTIEAFRRAFGAGRFTGNLIHASALFRRSTFEAVGGYDDAFDIGEDLDLFERMAELGPVLAVPEPLLYRRLHEGSISVYKHRRMQELMGFLLSRAQARSRGEAHPVSPKDWEAYEALRTDQGALSRLARRLNERSEYHYHTAALEFADGAWGRCVRSFAQSMTYNPFYAVPRVAQQLGPIVRESLLASEPAPSSQRAVHPASGRPVFEAAL